ncbi:TPA: hypothetical protein ENS27_14650 [bacterium]|jgi:hypothetical protein|nr:hypothetical protein [bacterium]
MIDINANTIGQVYQDIINEFSDINSARLDILETIRFLSQMNILQSRHYHIVYATVILRTDML